MEYGVKSDVGRVRLENQDRVTYFNNDDFAFLILCDGMGGHFGGGIASSTTINTFKKAFETKLPKVNDSINKFTYWFKNTVDLSRKEMLKISADDEAKLDMGTTLTAALINKSKKLLYIYNIGDSRTYVLTTYGELKQITRDHNLLNQLMTESNLSYYDAMQNPYAAALTSALGPMKKTKIELFDISSYYPKIFSILVTSDGVHDFLDKPEMEGIMRENLSADEICEKLVVSALDNKSTDNASAGIIVLDNKAEWR